MKERRILWYFLKSKVWLEYERTITKNPIFWRTKDWIRYETMAKAPANKLGITVEDYILDMYDCIWDSKLKESTKNRLWVEIGDLQKYHENMNTLEKGL